MPIQKGQLDQKNTNHWDIDKIQIELDVKKLEKLWVELVKSWVNLYEFTNFIYKSEWFSDDYIKSLQSELSLEK